MALVAKGRLLCLRSPLRHNVIGLGAGISITSRAAIHQTANKRTNNLDFAQAQSGTTSVPPFNQKPGISEVESRQAALEYLKAFDNKELMSFMMIGAATLSKPILNLCIRLFPFVPMAVIKALVYRVYCGGETIEEVKACGKRLSNRGIYNMMLSLTIEACNGNENVDPDYIVKETQRSITEMLIPHFITMTEESGKHINAIPPGYVALKPTGFSKDAANVLKNYNKDAESAAMFDELVGKVSSVCQLIYEANNELATKFPERVAPFAVAVIDAEKHELQEGVYELQRRLYAKFNQPNKPISIVGTLQMYLSDSANLMVKEEKLAMENNYRLGLKLVRGAYIHSEKDRQAVIHKTKEDTDNNYNQGISYCIESILANKKNELTIGHLVVATHNEDSLRLATEKLSVVDLAENNNKNNVVLGQLLGMADNITYNLIKDFKADNVIKYVPWGPPLETKEYLLRRLEENGDAVRSDNSFALIRNVSSILFKRLFRLT